MRRNAPIALAQLAIKNKCPGVMISFPNFQRTSMRFLLEKYVPFLILLYIFKHMTSKLFGVVRYPNLQEVSFGGIKNPEFG